MSNGTTERRAHARLSRTFELQQLDPSNSDVARMVASNLSLGGLYCTSTRDFDEMTRLAVRLLVPDGNGNGTEPIDVEAVVVRRRRVETPGGEPRFELALFFTGVEDQQRERLARFLAD